MAPRPGMHYRLDQAADSAIRMARFSARRSTAVCRGGSWGIPMYVGASKRGRPMGLASGRLMPLAGPTPRKLRPVFVASLPICRSAGPRIRLLRVAMHLFRGRASRRFASVGRVASPREGRRITAAAQRSPARYGYAQVPGSGIERPVGPERPRRFQPHSLQIQSPSTCSFSP